MSVDTQKLREAAQRVIDDFGDTWYGAEDLRGTRNDRLPVVDEQFIEEASPTAIIGFVETLDAQAKEIARLREIVETVAAGNTEHDVLQAAARAALQEKSNG